MTGPNPWADPHRTATGPLPPVPPPTAVGPYVPGSASEPNGPVRRRRVPPVAFVALAATMFLVAATMAALWISTRSELSAEQRHSVELRQRITDLEAQSADLRERNADLEQENADFQAQESQRAAVAADVPNLRQIADKYLSTEVSVYGNADYLDLTVTDSNAAAAFPGLIVMLDELGFSPAVVDRMSNTRALDGTLRAEGHNCNVTWTYHPDDGLQMVFEAVRPN